MFKLPKSSRLDAGDQDANNASTLDWFNQDDGESSFDSFNPFGTDALDWISRVYGGDPDSRRHSDWGASFALFPASAAGDGGPAVSSSPSGAHRSGSSSDPSETATLHSLFSPTSAAAGSSSSVASAVGLSISISGALEASSSAVSSQTVSTNGSGLVFNNTYTASCTAQYIACIVAAEKQLESLFTSKLTVNETFALAPLGKGSAAVNNAAAKVTVSYSQLKGALLKLAPGDVLPSADPSGGVGFRLPVAYARFLGLTKSAPATDDTVTLNSNIKWDFGQDAINSLTHELSEGALGRVGGLGDQNSKWSTMDLFRYTAAGVYDTTDGRDGQTTYFSSDGGATTSASAGLSFYNEYNGSTYKSNGDPDDWNQTAVFGGNGGGETFTLSQTELDVIAALGWKVALPQEIMTTSGNWETPTDWFDGFMPITPEDAFIGVLNTVNATLTSKVTVNSIGTNAASTLEISSGGHLTATDGTALNPADSSTFASGNLGALDIDTGSTLTIGDTFDNEGSTTVGVVVSSAGGNGTLVLNGAVTLNGSGVLNLGQQSGTFQANSTGSITGGGLVNVNNTIAGGGTINLSSFDNQAGGTVDANQSEGNSLRIIASDFTNEGTMSVESRSALDLGQDGSTGSLTNTGTILINGKADLAISGNYTLAGSGAIGMQGAGADITSDGTAQATFTNESFIVVTASGQIGDEGIQGSNDLALDNYGIVGASGPGVTLTLNTGGNIIGDDGGTLGAGDGATLAIDSEVDTGEIVTSGSPPPPGGTIEANSSGTVLLSAAVANFIHGFPSVSGQVVIDGGTFEMLAGSSVSVPVVFTASGGTLELFSIASAVNARGSNGTVDLTGSKVSISGGKDTIAFKGGSGDVANLSDTGGSADTVTGSKGAINLTSASISLSGSNDTIAAGSGDTITLKSGTGETISGSAFTVKGGSGTGFKIEGTGDVVYAGLNDAIAEGGSSTLFKIDSNVGSLSISGFGADSAGVIDLLKGVGGYKTAGAASQALTSDGHGGSLLSLASTGDGSIDFLSVKPSSLTSANFKIG
jgi:hypothetical protein